MGGDEVRSREDLHDILMECSEHLMWVDSMWSGAGDEERMEMCTMLAQIELELQQLIETRDVPWRVFRQATDLMAHASHSLNLLCYAEYTKKLSRLERQLRAATTDEGWNAYLKIDTLKSDETALRAARQCPGCMCGHKRYDQFMTSKSS